MKSETTFFILVTILLMSLGFGINASCTRIHECRKMAMEKSYPAIEIQGICK